MNPQYPSIVQWLTGLYWDAIPHGPGPRIWVTPRRRWSTVYSFWPWPLYWDTIYIRSSIVFDSSNCPIYRSLNRLWSGVIWKHLISSSSAARPKDISVPLIATAGQKDDDVLMQGRCCFWRGPKTPMQCPPCRLWPSSHSNSDMRDWELWSRRAGNPEHQEIPLQHRQVALDATVRLCVWATLHPDCSGRGMEGSSQAVQPWVCTAAYHDSPAEYSGQDVAVSGQSGSVCSQWGEV